MRVLIKLSLILALGFLVQVGLETVTAFPSVLIRSSAYDSSTDASASIEASRSRLKCCTPAARWIISTMILQIDEDADVVLNGRCIAPVSPPELAADEE